jgi:Cu(I)/Ag(I) efflux system membrane protein CusA/SilA
MPTLNEATFMYMPVTPYGIGADLAKQLAQKTNMVIKSFPEVQNTFAKAGRAATDRNRAGTGNRIVRTV